MALTPPIRLAGDPRPVPAAQFPWGLPVPDPGPGTCVRCRGPCRPDRRECYCCARVSFVLGEDDPATPGAPVMPLRLCRPGDQLHSALRRYKDAPSISARRHYTALLAGFLRSYLLRPDGWPGAVTVGYDAVAVVPSTGRGPSSGPGLRPFDRVAEAVPELAALRRVLLRRGWGTAGHLAPSSRAFELEGPGTGGRVLVLDDTWVTGARARSAASALARSGVAVAGIVVIGRAVDPGAGPLPSAWWARCLASAVGGQRLAPRR